jgi:RNA polymerase subunit RPABC4/transcription elongation factor Spt4
MDCHYTLARAVHEHCPVSASHHATGGWNGYNMKFSQELVDHSLDLVV